MCSRCQAEGRRRLKAAKTSKAAAEELKKQPMKFSKDNTMLRFRFRGDDPLMELTIVEESLICLTSAVVAIQRLETRDGMLELIMINNSELIFYIHQKIL